jgi:hypothetical protein
MNPQALPFAFAVLSGLVTWAAISRRYLWPWLEPLDLASAAEPILYLHAFRYLGLAFIAPSVVGPALDHDWAMAAALGDVGAAALAVVALLARRTRAARPALWLFNVWGTLDLLRAFVDGVPKGANLSMQATWFVVTAFVPLLLCTHAMLYMVLLRPQSPNPAGGACPLEVRGGGREELHRPRPGGRLDVQSVDDDVGARQGRLGAGARQHVHARGPAHRHDLVAAGPGLLHGVTTDLS